MPMQTDFVEKLNANCHCIHVDQRAALGALPEGPHNEGHPFAPEPVFVSEGDLARMKALVEVIERLREVPQLRAHALAEAPEIAGLDPGTPGLVFGYDFHLGEAGPQLIEVNTNAGGLLMLARAFEQTRGDCASLDGWIAPSTVCAEAIAERAAAMFHQEWRHFGAPKPLERVVIVDEAPERQFLYAELVAYQSLLQSEGIEVEIVDPSALRFEGGVLRTDSGPVDLVYNRLTDFYFEAPHLWPLKRAYETGSAAISPHPHAHALMARKSNLALWSDEAALVGLGVDPDDAALLSAHVPETWLVDEGADEEALWSGRKGLYFKPACGYGSRATYAGAKLTRKTLGRIMEGGYVAQKKIAPTTRALSAGEKALKYDVRLFTYEGEVLMVGARLYRGQTTNMRTPLGGLAPVVVV